jgi:hypothetical protein
MSRAAHWEIFVMRVDDRRASVFAETITVGEKDDLLAVAREYWMRVG